MVLSETQNGFRAEFLKVMAALYDVGLAQLQQRLAKPNILCSSLIIRQRDKFLKGDGCPLRCGTGPAGTEVSQTKYILYFTYNPPEGQVPEGDGCPLRCGFGPNAAKVSQTKYFI